MLVVAITSVVAALAIYSITAYLEAARGAEAKNFVRAINDGAQAAYERESVGADVLVDGAAVTETHTACGSAPAVPATVQSKGKKYQPNTAGGADFNQGDGSNGWKCVRFQTSQPIYYQYSYYWQDTAMTVAQNDWQRGDFGDASEPSDRSFMPVVGLMAAGGKKDGIDGDGNRGHGNNTEEKTPDYVGCDPDNPGRSKDCDGGGSGDGSGSGSGFEEAGAVEPWCVTNCWEAGAKSEDVIFLAVTRLSPSGGLQTALTMLYRK